MRFKTTEKTYLDELVEADGQKVFFVSAYQSASKGLNPIIKNKKGEQKDFDSLVLLMDSYYTAMGPALYKAQDAGQAVTAYHFSLMKSIVHLGVSFGFCILLTKSHRAKTNFTDLNISIR